MKIRTLWVVVNPRQTSELQDICFELTPLEYFKYCLGGTTGDNGTRVREIEEENHMFHTTDGSAKEDAEARLRARDQALVENAERKAWGNGGP